MTASSRALAALAALALLLAAACASPDATGPVAGAEAASTRTGTAEATGDHSVRGRVVAVGDSSRAGEVLTPVAGAEVRVVLLSRTPTPGVDSSVTPATRAHAGTVTTDADGRFELTRVAAGYYALEVTPPAAAGVREGTGHSVSLAPDDPAVAIVYLYPR